ncbi:hypothetical protein ACWF0M_14650 [Kribbella sp. NPDC055110]
MRIRTVLNDLAPDALGMTDSHDHLFFRSAALPGQELHDEAAAVAEVRAFADAGGQAIVFRSNPARAFAADWRA